MQRTFIIFKPDCLDKKLVGTVLARFEQAGFSIIGCKMMILTPALLRVHYAHVTHFPFYPKLEQFMSSRPVVAVALQGENVIARVREMLGPTDSSKAPKGTIRGDFGESGMINVVHASDSVENAEIEIKRFFKPEEVFELEPAAQAR
ncbi:nucleoside-diphosphate kinase [Ereboglobus luteus]|uniref:Nucleoside diphosphate kinase n=1 Tax=Ereboglobus luteus TaxID=1796921 RepID=A0A2U8E4F9_9BACT|nr:nucleoside-diphosphate kinase [Ereboglobus luteus]AWI09434.1 nucleoside-diphosphate kinase [Ereboglobus luteus]